MRWDESNEDVVHDDVNIKGFVDSYRWLSNFYPCSIVYENQQFKSSEAAYQAAKCKNIADREKFLNLNARDSKKLGKTIEIREDWNDVKLSVMKDILHDKFTRNPILGQSLIETEDRYLEETNWWGDTFWGVYKGKGENWLGKQLMELRGKL